MAIAIAVLTNALSIRKRLLRLSNHPFWLHFYADAGREKGDMGCMGGLDHAAKMPLHLTQSVSSIDRATGRFSTPSKTGRPIQRHGDRDSGQSFQRLLPRQVGWTTVIRQGPAKSANDQ